MQTWPKGSRRNWHTNAVGAVHPSKANLRISGGTFGVGENRVVLIVNAIVEIVLAEADERPDVELG